MKKTDVIVVLGLDEAKKPHAAQFEIAAADAVRKAARLMGFRTALPKTDEARNLAQQLIEGKLFATGRGLVPFCKMDTYEKLVKMLELEPEVSAVPSAPANASAAKTSGLNPFDNLKVGSVVIAEESKDLGWWRATITTVNKDKLTLRWIDGDAKQPSVVRKRQAVALLFPG
jgi:hypothetical protein